ncbi:MAG TPA: cohesin domain-containing protein [Thermoanaerobaculia bacterium]|nr:cohesin domain-containing protein [Thermoanaerobaculia bacterium]
MGYRIARPLSVLLTLAVLVSGLGCSSYRNHRQAEIAEQNGNWDEAVLQYMKAAEQDPSNIKLKASLMRAKIKASQVHFEKGQEYEKAGALDRALIEYQQAVQLDTTNQYAQAQLANVRRAMLAQRQNREGGTIDDMKQRARQAAQPPQLNPRSNQPISLDFPEPVSIFQIYRALGKAFGINILFDPNLKDTELAITLTEVTAQSALEMLMRTAGHFYKVQDEHTIIIAADTPQNRRIYEDLVIQTFFLSNSDPKQMTTTLRSLVDAKKIAVNEQLNAVILRDTADRVKVAERVIQTNDKSKAEVVIDVELLQINTGRLRELGASLQGYTVTQSLEGSSNGFSSVRVSDLEFLNQSNWILSIPNVIYDFVKSNTDAQLLAKPQLRITDGEKANLIIGDKVPIPLTTFNTQNAGAAGGIIPITSFQYQDVGIRIDIEPRVHHNQEITLKIKVEVSNINGFVEASGGQEQPVIGTRTIESTIRLQDGETNFLAGLIRSDETESENGIPGLSDIPVLGRIFSKKRTENQRTDVILTLTPHIVRNAEITEDDLAPIWVGTENNITFRGGSPRVESDVEGPFDGNEGTPEEIQDAIRRRIQRLPRGLRPEDAGAVTGEEGFVEEGEAPPPPQPPTGVDPVPVAPPTDAFRPAPPPEPVVEEPPIEEPPARNPGPRFLWRGVGDSGEEAAASAPVRLRLAADRPSVAPGDTFEVRLEAEALREVSHLPLTLSFDPAVLAVEKVEAGEFLGGSDVAQALADTSKSGELVLGLSRLGQVPGVKGEGTLVRITFRALQEGAAEIGFTQSQALDWALRPMVPVAAAPVQVGVKAGAARPKPAPVRPQVSQPSRREV